jgi:hypothetical protein
MRYIIKQYTLLIRHCFAQSATNVVNIISVVCINLLRGLKNYTLALVLSKYDSDIRLTFNYIDV